MQRIGDLQDLALRQRPSNAVHDSISLPHYYTRHASIVSHQKRGMALHRHVLRNAQFTGTGIGSVVVGFPIDSICWAS